MSGCTVGVACIQVLRRLTRGNACMGSLVPQAECGPPARLVQHGGLSCFCAGTPPRHHTHSKCVFMSVNVCELLQLFHTPWRNDCCRRTYTHMLTRAPGQIRRSVRFANVVLRSGACGRTLHSQSANPCIPSQLGSMFFPKYVYLEGSYWPS